VEVNKVKTVLKAKGKFYFILFTLLVPDGLEQPWFILSHRRTTGTQIVTLGLNVPFSN
jgi:hypothetical protein